MEWSLDTAAGRAAISAVVVGVAVLVGWLAGRGLASRADDVYQRYYARKIARWVAGFLAVVVLIIVWQPFGGRFSTWLGLATAGIAFAMQEVIGAFAGWFNITIGRIYKVGDRVEVGDVHGDVIDITPLRTVLMEIGTSGISSSWVKGRQHTGRVVAVSNKATFTTPVFNYSALFSYVWEELEVAIPHHEDWERASAILAEEVRRHSEAEGARTAMDEVQRRFPVPSTEVAPRVFTRADEDHVRLSARFVVPVRSARTVKDAIYRAVVDRLAEADIEIVASTVIEERTSDDAAN
jgi:small-conductance mechanosensitive channel